MIFILEATNKVFFVRCYEEVDEIHMALDRVQSFVRFYSFLLIRQLGRKDTEKASGPCALYGHDLIKNISWLLVLLHQRSQPVKFCLASYKFIKLIKDRYSRLAWTYLTSADQVGLCS